MIQVDSRSWLLGWALSAGTILSGAIVSGTVVGEDRGLLLDRLESHCVECHSDDVTEGEFNLQSLLESTAGPEEAARALERIRRRVAAGEMPPEEAESLSEEDRSNLVVLVDGQLEHLSERLRDDPGDVAMPRLAPYEYRNVIRDLSGGVVIAGGRLLPNEGGAGEGFANVGSAQVMTPTQYEKYIDAAKDVLRHLRTYPTADDRIGKVWKSYPREAVDSPVAARKEVVDEIIAWYIGQQQKWGAEHREDLQQKLGFVHAAYLEAAWHFHHRDDRATDIETHASVAGEGPLSERVKLAPAAMKKWCQILHSDSASSPHAEWAAKWKELASENDLKPAEVRKRCVSIVAGNNDIVVETEDYAPAYEISFHEAKEEVLEAARSHGHWPFRIEIGDAKELFLVVTDAGDGNRGEYAVWRNGRFVFRDGSSRAWQDVVTIRGARSGKEYAFGFDGEKSKVLSDDAVGAKPPGTLKFAVPENAIVFEVELTLDEKRTKLASIQALVLREKPESSSYIPGRFVFGGKKRPITAGAKLKQAQERALRKRNLSEANKTKIGLNAERNVFALWNRSPLESIGGPWPSQEAEKYEANFPYHYTVSEVLLNASDADLAELRRLEDRLACLARVPDESRLRRQAESFVSRFASQAWRRDIAPTERRSLMALYDNARGQGLSFDRSVKSSLLLVLSSPHFLYKLYPTVGRTREVSNVAVVPLSSQALATRLSFFLWGSLPDERLLELARADQLGDLAILKREAQRMLHDGRGRSLAADFGGQLWDFSEFGTFDNPDQDRYPEFIPALRAAMIFEVEYFLADLFQNDRPLTNILSADYTFANEILAAHYGLDVGELDGTQRVGLSRDRGGLATMGLFLTKKSLPLRTSPVQRGVWVMENLLGRQLPNPPADVPALSEDDTDQAGLSIREQLERHRAQASCASCHDKIDPLGLSLESFDAIGRQRDSHRDGSAIAIEAQSHDGYTLRGSSSLQEYLVKHRDEFVDHFVRKLVGYALGRSVQIGDRALMDRMRQRLEKNQYRFSVLIDEIVVSPQFRMRRSPSE